MDCLVIGDSRCGKSTFLKQLGTSAENILAIDSSELCFTESDTVDATVPFKIVIVMYDLTNANSFQYAAT